MEDRARRRESEARAEEVFLAYLARRRDGTAEPLESLCDQHADLRGELLVLHGDMVALERLREKIDDDGLREPALRRLLEDLRRPRRFGERFEGGSAIGSGGQGEVREARERSLQRVVAIKSLRRNDAGASAASAPELARFLAEAQITAQLDHPGIVAVHELGLDEGGDPYFTMNRVRGRELSEIFRRSRSGDPEWPLVRCLTVLQRVCDTMTFAHSRGVVHRDLKPANIMVGSFGEVFVMDWGLARVFERSTRDGRDGDTGPATTSAVQTVRDGPAARRDPLLATLAGENLGTVFYMAPELARDGAVGSGPTADVYAVGAMLYELSSGRPPFWTGRSDATHAVILERIRSRPPEPLWRCAPGTPPELVSICERAMARDPAERYPDFRAFSSDLRAFLEDRVVRAHRTGPWAELRKWIARNRRLAAALLLALLLALVGSAAVAAVAAVGRTRLDLQADLYRLPYLEEQAQTLWPEIPERIPAFERWIEAAETLAGRLDQHRRELANLRRAALPNSMEALATFRARSPLRAELVSTGLLTEHLTERLATVGEAEKDGLVRQLAELAARREKIEGQLDELRPWTFPSPSDQLRHDTLAETVIRLDAFSDPETGLLADVRRRLEWARTVRERTITAAHTEWAKTRQVLAARDSPYALGFALPPQLGLIPLGPDPRSGLLEFAFPRSGTPPVRERGDLVLREETSLVFVLVPAGDFLMGAQSADPSAEAYDAQAQSVESPPGRVALAPFFISKYEMTRGQWRRLTGASPSLLAADALGDLPDLHPVEGVSWQDCMDVLPRFGLTLPTEAQWERATRAGTSAPFFASSDPRTLAGQVNLADVTVVRAGLAWPQTRGMEWLDDGFVRHAPVGRFAPNAFGLHDTLGNVWEWCLDQPGSYAAPCLPDTGLRVAAAADERVARGGGFVNDAAFARTTIRDLGRSRDFDSSYHGLRPVFPGQWAH